MHDIKYFFLNKINQTIQGAKNIFRGGDKLPKNTVFQNPRGSCPPLDDYASAPDHDPSS
jgi:hypothetical protein